MTDHDHDLNDDQSLERMAHAELVDILNRLYVRLGEPRVAASVAHASTADEVRSSIRVVRRRLAIKLGVASELPDCYPAAPELAADPPEGDTATTRPKRVFVVLFTSQENFASSARAACRARGVPLVSIAALDILAALVASVTPTHIVIVGEGFEREDVAASTILVRNLESRSVQVVICEGTGDAMQALAEIRA